MKQIIYLSVIFCLTACLPDSPKEEESTTVTTVINLNSFSITGTSADENGVTPINQGVNGGTFSLSWNISAENSGVRSDSYFMGIYASLDNTLDTSSDTKLIGLNCNIPLSFCQSTSQTPSCTFNNENVVDCGDFGSKNLSDILTSLPQTVFIFAEVCDSLFTICKSASHTVEFR
jgi:hypothetical protein